MKALCLAHQPIHGLIFILFNKGHIGPSLRGKVFLSLITRNQLSFLRRKLIPLFARYRARFTSRTFRRVDQNHFPCHQFALLIFTRQTLYSGVPAPGSSAAMVKSLVLGPGLKLAKPQLQGIPIVSVSFPLTLYD